MNTNGAIKTLVSCALPMSECTRSWKGAQPRQLTFTCQRGIPYHRTSCLVYKLGRVVQQLQLCHWPVGDEQLHCASLFFCCFIPLYHYFCGCYHCDDDDITFCVTLLNCSYLNLCGFIFLSGFPSHWGRERSE